MHILITGASGQLGRALQRAMPTDIACTALSRDALDITDPSAIATELHRLRPTCVINAAAYTAVDQAEQSPHLADAINHHAVAAIAELCTRFECSLLHVSTDFVFDGAANTPYQPDAPTAPQSAYGASKLAGERAALANCASTTIVRTSWLYGPGGNNFVRTMLRLLRERPALSIVSDQFGSPTHVDGLAHALLALSRLPSTGSRTLHWCDAGTASWFDLASAVRCFARQRWTDAQWGELHAIRTEDYPTAATRPRFSVLDASQTYGLVGSPPSWLDRLEQALLNDHSSDWLA